MSLCMCSNGHSMTWSSTHQTIETTTFIAVMPISDRFFDYLYCSYNYVNIINIIICCINQRYCSVEVLVNMTVRQWVVTYKRAICKNKFKKLEALERFFNCPRLGTSYNVSLHLHVIIIISSVPTQLIIIILYPPPFSLNRTISAYDVHLQLHNKWRL